MCYVVKLCCSALQPGHYERGQHHTTRLELNNKMIHTIRYILYILRAVCTYWHKNMFDLCFYFFVAPLLKTTVFPHPRYYSAGSFHLMMLCRDPCKICSLHQACWRNLLIAKRTNKVNPAFTNIKTKQQQKTRFLLLLIYITWIK